MKNKIFTILFALAALLATTSCGREDIDYDRSTDAKGQINLKDLLVDIEEENSTRVVNTDEFTVRIIDVASGIIHKQWIYQNMPEIATLKVGNYLVEAYSHELEVAAFENPYYHGEQTFTIKENEVTKLNKLTCTFSNIKVTIEYESDLAFLLGDDVNVKVQIGECVLNFAKAESRAGYFAADNDVNIMTAELTGTIDGEAMSLRKVFSDVKAGEHRAIKFSMKGSGSGDISEEGGAAVGIEIDADCTIYDKDVEIGVDEGVIEDDEEPTGPTDPVEPGDPVAPVIEGVGFDIEQPINVPADGMEIVVDMTSEIGFKNINVTIDSETLTDDILNDVGLGSQFDLANPGDLAEGLASLEFPIGDQVIGAKEIKFDITNFTPLLGIYGAATHRFIINVIDLEGNSTTKTLTLISE